MACLGEEVSLPASGCCVDVVVSLFLVLLVTLLGDCASDDFLPFGFLSDADSSSEESIIFATFLLLVVVE